QRPPPSRASREAERHVAQVEEEAAEPAGDVDREVPSAATEPDRVTESKLRGADLARWQVDELEAAGDELEISRSGPGVDRQPAGGVTCTNPAGDDHAGERAEHVL